MPLHCYYGYVIIDLQKKLGQLFFVGFEGYTLTREVKQFLRTVQPGGIIFFECNIKNKKQVKKLINEINNCIEIKPFIAVDQEGGSVERLRNICTSLPSMWGLSKVGLKELLEVQKIIINELLELGFNMNFSPVLDVNSNPANPIIGTRAISHKPEIVADYGAKIIELYLKNKIISVAKHFPGHGDLNIDSHLRLPILNKDKSKLNNFEFIPFKKAIKIKVPVIMLGHIQLPKIENDKKIPSSLSKKIIDGILRKELGFKGLIITDELNMKGITKNFSLEQALLKAVQAGADLILLNQFIQSTSKVYKKIFDNIQKDKHLQKRIEESYKRIITMKKQLFIGVKADFVKAGFKPVSIASTSKHQLLSQNLASKVVHWIKRDLFFKSVIKNESLEIIYPKTHRLKKEDIEAILKTFKTKEFKLYEYGMNPKIQEIVSINKRLKKNTRKIVITYDISAWKGQKSLVETFVGNYPDLIIISAGLENDLELTPKIKNFIAAYAPNYVSLMAAFNKLFIQK